MSPAYRMVAQLGEQLKKKEFINHVRDYDSETFKQGSAGQWFESIPYDSVTHTAKETNKSTH